MRVYYIITLCIISSYCFSQTTKISGIVQDKNTTIQFANIILLGQDSSFVSGTITDKNGKFSVSGEVNNSGILQVSYLGYQTKNISVNSKKPDLGIINIVPVVTDIGEVVVSGNKRLYQLKGTSIITNVSTTPLATIGNGFNVVNNVPGVRVSDNNVLVFGKGSPLIYINNRRVIDISEIEMLQSSEIASVELIRNPGAKYDAEEKSVLIIKTKKQVFNGIAVVASEELRIAENIGDTENLKFSYTKDNLRLFGSYYRSKQKTPILEQDMFRIDSDTLWQQNIEMPFDYGYTFHRARGGFDWSFAKTHSIGAQYTYFENTKRTTLDYGTANVSANGALYDQVETSFKIKELPKEHLVNAFYRGDFSDNFSLQFDVDYFKSETSKDQKNKESSSIEGDRDVDVNSQSDFLLFANKLSIEFVPNKTTSIVLGGEYNNIKGDGYMLNPQSVITSNIYTNKETKEAVFGSFAKQMNKWNLKFGLRYEHANEKMTEGIEENENVNRTYNGFYPNISIAGEINKVQASLSFNSKVVRPSFAQLNSNNVYVNRFLVQQGNPYLKQTDVYESELQLMYKIVAFGLGYRYENNPISFGVEDGSQSSYSTITSLNYSKYEVLNAFAAVQYKVGFWGSSLTMGLVKPFFEIENNTYNKLGGIVRFNNNFGLPKNYIISIDYDYQGNMYEYAFYAKEVHQVDLGIRKSFFKKALDVKVELQDVFNSQKNRFEMDLGTYNMNQVKKNESRYLTIRLQYNFNTYKKRYRGKNAAPYDLRRL